MELRNASILRPVLAVLAVTMLVVALACASEAPAPTSPPATSPPSTSAPVDDAQPTETPVQRTETDLGWMEQYLQSPGYDPAWGEPRERRDIYLWSQPGQY